MHMGHRLSLCCLQLVHNSEALTDAVKELLEGHSQQGSTPQSQADAPQQVATDVLPNCTVVLFVDTCYNESSLQHMYNG